MGSVDLGFHVFNAYVGRVRSVAATLQDKPSASRLARLLARIRAGEPVIVTGHTLDRDVLVDILGLELDAWYHLRPDGTIDYLREYRGKTDMPPEIGRHQ